MLAVYGSAVPNFAVLGVAAVFCLSCWYFWTHRRVLAVARKLPAWLPTFPLLGHVYLVMYGLDGVIRILKEEIFRAMSQSVSVVAFWIGFSPIFYIFGTEEFEAVLTSAKTSDRGPEINFIRSVLGNGLLTAPGHIAKVIRRYIVPVFHSRNVDPFMPALNECARDLVDNLTAHEGCSSVDVYDYTYSVTAKSICMLLLGPHMKVDFHSKTFQDLLKAISSTEKLVSSRFVKIWLWPEFIFQYLHKKELEFIKTTLRNFSKDPDKAMERGNKADHVSNHVEDRISTETYKGGRQHVTLVEAYTELQRDHPGFTEQDFRNEIISMLIAGTETTKVLICSCLLALAANPEIQERLYREIVSVVDVFSPDVTFENLKDLTFLDEVIQETLRKFVILQYISRRPQEDIKLKDFTIPAGSYVSLLQNSLHMNPHHFPEPDRFDPERFSPENTARRKRFSFLPFGFGPRGCIGKTYSISNAKTMVIHVLARFKLSTDVNIDNVRYTGAITPRRVGGYPIRLERRR